MKNFGWILLFIVFVLVLVTFRSKMMEWFSKDDQDTEYKAIRKYLLNDSPLYGFNKPKLWIHTKYDINARNWLKTRNSTNQKMRIAEFKEKVIEQNAAAKEYLSRSR